jgi:phosphomannomutase
MLNFAVRELEADAGVMVTAGHNTHEWNGFKLVLNDGAFYGEAIEALATLAAIGDWDKGLGSVRSRLIEDTYVSRLLTGYRGGAFKVAWHCGKGLVGAVVRKLVRRLPGEHQLLFDEADLEHERHSNGLGSQDSLLALKQHVLASRCDLGVLLDGDGSRMIAVDCRGRALLGDKILAILARSVLQDLPGAIIIGDVKSSQVMFDTVQQLGGTALMWKTGHSLIRAKMMDVHAALAGEMSGHIHFAQRWYGFDDGIFAALRLLETVHQFGGSLAELVDAMPMVPSTPELRFAVLPDRKFNVIMQIRQRLRAAGFAINDTDGVRVSRPHGWWLIRASNTHDGLSGRAEACSETALMELIDEMCEHVALAGVSPLPTNIRCPL